VILGKTTPRIYSKPLRKLVAGTAKREFMDRTTDGFAAIKFAKEVLGLSLFPWQEWLLIHALELVEDENGTLVYRFRIVVVSVGRQNGKTVVATILALWHLFARESRTIIGTAQDLSKADDTWLNAVAMAESNDELAELFSPDDIFKGHPKTFALLDGSEYRVASATRRGGRGFSGDLILLDELREHSNWESWSAVTNTMNARPKAQAWAFSNAGDLTSVVLRYQRALAHRDFKWPDGEREFDGVLDDLDDELVEMLAEMEDLKPGWFEWSAPLNAKRNDEQALAQSNPSMNHTEISDECPTTRTLLAALAGSPAYEYETEVMCRWATMGVGGPFPEGSWEATVNAKARPTPESKKVVCVEVSSKRNQTFVARAGLNDKDNVVVGIRYDHPGTEWVAESLAADRDSTEMVVVRTEAGSSAATLYETLQRDLVGIRIQEWKATDVAVGHSQIFDRLRDKTIEHLPHQGLDAAATSALESLKPGGGFRIDIKRSPTDVGALYAVIGAVWGVEQLGGLNYDIMESVV
jgi:hypothetical protein